MCSFTVVDQENDSILYSVSYTNQTKTEIVHSMVNNKIIFNWDPSEENVSEYEITLAIWDIFHVQNK
jgi:hypothetical protein